MDGWPGGSGITLRDKGFIDYSGGSRKLHICLMAKEELHTKIVANP